MKSKFKIVSIHPVLRYLTNDCRCTMNSKSAAAVLQELMVQKKGIPDYEFLGQHGPQHSPLFQYRCTALGAVVTASAKSKKEAKQEAARLILLKLSASGHKVPAPYNVQIPTTSNTNSEREDNDHVVSSTPRSYVALLRELCEEYHLPAVDYLLISDTGPPHLRHFTIKAKMGLYERLATATTKKAARQLAAEQLYTYLRENLVRVTQDFSEDEALVRAHERAMDKYIEIKEEQVWRPDLGQKISEYHLGLLTQIDEDKRNLALEALQAPRTTADVENLLARVVSILGLQMEFHDFETLFVVEILQTTPEIVVAGKTHIDAVTETLDYLLVALRPM